MAKFFSRLFSRGSSLHGSQSSLSDKHNRSRSKTPSTIRTGGSLENLSSYHIHPKELEKSKLHKASWEGNLQKVTRFARPGQINLKDQHMRTPIHLAIVKGHIGIVRYLVQENAKLDLVDNEQRTPLIKAVLSGNQNPQINYQICQILVEGGAGDSINAIDKQGRSALHYAIDFGNQQLVDLFLSHENCDPNLPDRDLMTPLHLAIKRNNPHIVQSLLSDQHDQQADPNITNRYGQTPLHLAASVGYIDIVRLLLFSNLQEPCDPTILDSQQATAYQTAKNNHQEACAKLIEEYQQNRYKPDLRRQTTTSFNEQLSIKAANSLSMTPAANLQHDPDETSENSSYSTTKPSLSSPRRAKRPSDQWSDDNDPSISQRKGGIQSLFKTNPLQPDQPQKNTPSTINQLLNNNPLEPKSKKPTSESERVKSTSFFGIGPVIERVDSDNTSTSKSVDKLAKPSSENKPATVPKPAPTTKSWSDDTISAPPVKKPEPRSNSWDTSTSEDDQTISKSHKPSTNLQKTKPFSASVINLTSSDSDDNSVETKIRKVDAQKPSIETNTNKPIELSKVQSPRSDDSSWTTSPIPFNEQLPPKGVQNLVQKVKSDDSTWDDDSRPLSTDVSKRQTTGVDNLTKIVDTIMQSTKKQASPKVIGKLVVSSMGGDQTDSVFSEIDKKEWSVTSTHTNELKTIQQLPYSSFRLHDTGSKRSSSSSFHDERITELKENIKKLERDQETAHELKRQLRDMENKKNNFEKLYRENDRMLRDIEDRLEEEKIEKNRLETATKNLNTELKNIKQQLQQLEDEKDLLNQRCRQLKEERDNDNDKIRAMQTETNSFRDEDVDKIKTQHRENMKSLSAENDNLYHRTKQLKSDLDLHREAIDYTDRYKIELEKTIEEKNYYQREFDRLKSEKNMIEEEKIEYKTKYNSLQEEIRLILLDRSKLEQKLTGELQEHFQEKQRSTGDAKKYRTQIEQLNIKLDDAETRLQSLQSQNQTLLTSKDTLTQRLNQTEPSTEQHHQRKPLPNKTLTSSLQPQTNIMENNPEFNNTFPPNENHLILNSRQMRSDTERVKTELDRLRQEFDRLVSTYEPVNNYHHQTKLHSQIDTFRHFYEQEFRQRQLLMSKITPERTPTRNVSSTYADNRLYKERLESAIDTSLSEQRLQTITHLPRQASALLTINTTKNGLTSSVELFRNDSNV